MTAPPGERFYVVEVEGGATTRCGSRRSAPMGLSVSVLDRAVCHREVVTYRSETFSLNGRSNVQRREIIRERAAALAVRLNAADAEAMAA